MTRPTDARLAALLYVATWEERVELAAVELAGSADYWMVANEHAKRTLRGAAAAILLAAFPEYAPTEEPTP